MAPFLSLKIFESVCDKILGLILQNKRISNFHKGFLIPHLHDVSSCRKFDFTTILFFLFQFLGWFTKFQKRYAIFKIEDFLYVVLSVNP